MSGRRLAVLVAAALATVTAAAAPAQPVRAKVQITVLAAASLTNVFPRIDASPRYSFAGSDTLAAQIRLGAPVDVFASANMSLPTSLYNAGLVEKPAVFTGNKLVLITPRSNPAGIRTVFDLRRPGIKLVVGTASVPIGAYTRTILKNLGLTGVLGNVVSQETDVRAILAKVSLGEADAGFVYATDAKTVSDRLSVIRIPAWAQPPVRYGIAVVRSTRSRADAVAFINRVLSKAGQAKLAAAGFLRVKGQGTSYTGG
jgi:molybdate transport system substrate-binding protein